MRKSLYVAIGLIIITIAAYSYLRFDVLKTKYIKPKTAQARSAIDLRPLLIAKLQELIKDGSDGLYNLQIEKINPDVLTSTVDLFHVTLTPDSSALAKLIAMQKGPDDVFKLSFDTLHINGISLNDFLSKKNISLDTILLNKPTIITYYTLHNYNAEKRKQDSALTLYQRITKQFKSIAINAIIIQNANFSTIEKAGSQNNQTINNISVRISNLLIDSTTQFDNRRFLFSKNVELFSDNYLLRTPDSLYFFKVGHFYVDAVQHKMVVTNLSFIPRGSVEQFESKLKTMNDRFTVNFPKIIFTNVDWWRLLNREKFLCDTANISGGEIDDYLDRSVPASPHIDVKDFPGQLLVQCPLKVFFRKINVHNIKVAYKEYNPSSRQSGFIFLDAINGSFTNITNIEDSINKNANFDFFGEALFASKVAMAADFHFDLSKTNTGNFSVNLKVGKIDTTYINPVAAPLGMFKIQKGTIQSGIANVVGNDFSADAKVNVLYNDIELVPLKRSNDDLKKKTIFSFVANTFLIKKNNPSKNEKPRISEVTCARDHHDSFFNFVWHSISTSILKTVGISKNKNSKS